MAQVRAALLGVMIYAVLAALGGVATGPIMDAREPLQTGDAAPAHGRPQLLGALLSGRMPPAAALANLDEATRRDFEARVALRAAYVPVRRPARQYELAAIDDKKGDIEGYLVACAGRRDVAPVAARYSSAAVLAYEWEGFSEGPLAEAAHAERYLRRYARSVLRGGLELFLLHRYRAAFEAASFQGNRDDHQVAAEGYKATWVRVQAIQDAVVQAVARDIDAARWVYVRVDGHPRTFGR